MTPPRTHSGDSRRDLLKASASPVVCGTLASSFIPTGRAEAGEHVFAEKPVATNSPGVRPVLESAALAKWKNQTGVNLRTLSGMVLGLATVLTVAGCKTTQPEQAFVKLFDGKPLKGWTLVGGWGPGYGVTNGLLYCSKGTGGNFFTEKEYSNFVLRLDYKLTPGANNGVGIRAPYEGIPAYTGMEIQILDDTAPQYANLRPGQFNGSIYDVVAAKRGALKPLGEWNSEEIIADGPHIKVVLNGMTVVDANLNEIMDPAVLHEHPGLKRNSGHIGLLSHEDYVEFRNIRIKELPETR